MSSPMAHATSRFALVLALLVSLAGCASRSAMRIGEHAEQLQEYDRAIIEYTKALRLNPENRVARRALERAKLRASQDHFTRGRRLDATGRLDEALIELQSASELNPVSAEIDDAMRSVRTQLRNKVAVAREGKTSLESLIDRSRDLSPAGFDLPDVRLPESIIFRDASSRIVYSTIARYGN